MATLSELIDCLGTTAMDMAAERGGDEFYWHAPRTPWCHESVGEFVALVEEQQRVVAKTIYKLQTIIVFSEFINSNCKADVSHVCALMLTSSAIWECHLGRRNPFPAEFPKELEPVQRSGVVVDAHDTAGIVHCADELRQQILDLTSDLLSSLSDLRGSKERLSALTTRRLAFRLATDTPVPSGAVA